MKLRPPRLLVAVLVVAACSLNASAQRDYPSLVTVTGTSEVLVVPDEVVLSLGVESRDKALSTAKAQNDQIVAKALGISRTFGLEAKHVQTDFIGVEPRYDHNQSSLTLIGYHVKKNLVITLKDISKFERLLTELLEAGVNHVHGVQFRTNDLRKHRDRARALAVAAAREKAAALATDLNRGVGKAHTISEGGYGYYGFSANSSQNVSQNTGGGSYDEGSAVALGQIKVSASVTVSFELQ